MPRDGTYLPQETQTDRDLAVLRAAREEIARPGGWCQGPMCKGDARCALGWLNEIGGYQGVDEWRAATRRLLFPALPWLHRLGGEDNPIGSVGLFNDLIWRRQSTVARLFDRAIARVEKQRDAP